jgi:ADP-ribose pyrophosphatase
MHGGTQLANNAVRESSRRIFSGRVFHVDVDRVRLPHGPHADMEVVRHPTSVVVIPIDADERIVLVRQYRYAVDQWLWELPAGSVDAGESPETAAARECAEETGRKPGTLEHLGAFYPSPGFCDELMIFFRLSDLAATSPEDGFQLDEDEYVEIRTFTAGEIAALIERGEIQDMKTIVGIGLL